VIRCPVCTKVQVVYVQGPERTSCYYCGARWIQRGAEQDGVIGRGSPESALRSMGHVHLTPRETS
jgi:Zn-finger nucleic acid-binding protein